MNIAQLSVTQDVTLGVSILVFVGLIALFVFMAKKHPLLVQKVVSDLEKGAQVADTVIKDIDPFVPAVVKPVVNILDEALNAADTAAHYAEQMFKNDPSIDRKALATQYAATVFKEAGITLTPSVAQILDGAIEAIVDKLPPLPPAVKEAAQKLQAAKAQ